MKKYRYIAFLGVDGSGKSTLSQVVSKMMGAQYTFQPLGKDENELTFSALRDLALNDIHSDCIDDTTRELLMIANRSAGNKIVTNLLRIGDVITDRSHVSGEVYARYNFHRGSSRIDRLTWKRLNNVAIAGCPQLDTIVFITPSIAKRTVGTSDVYDSRDDKFFNEILSLYEESLHEHRKKGTKVIEYVNDMEKTVEENAKAIHKLIVGTE